MYRGKNSLVVDYVGRIFMDTDPFWFYNLVIFFDEDNQRLQPRGMLSFYHLFVDQLDMKLYEEQIPHSINTSKACFFYMN